MDNVSQDTQSHQQKPLRLKLIVAGTLLLILVLAATSAFIFINRQPSDPLTADFSAAQNQANFPLFVPKKLPEGYSYQAGSLRINNDIAVFSIKGPGNRALAVTEQAKPQGYDFSKLSGTVEFNTDLGKNYVEDFEIRTTGSIVGDKTWLIINTDNPIGADDMKAVLQSFQTLVR